MFAALALAYRTRPVFVPTAGPNDPVARYRTAVMSRLRLVGIGVPLFVGLMAGFVAQSYWDRVQLFLHGGSFGVTDPQFNIDLGFYAFDLPFYRLVLSYLLVATFLAFIANLLGHYLFGGIRLSGRTGAVSKAARIQLISLVGTFVLLKAVAYWLDRYELLSHTRGGKPFTGAGYTDINAVLPAKLILMAIAIICAIAAVGMTIITALQFAYDEAHAPTQATYITFLSMCLFELCLGAYFALVGAVKARQVPERLRAAVYGSFRVPMNLLVVILELASPSSAWCFLTCSLLLLAAVGCFAAAHFGFAKQRLRALGQPLAKTEAAPLVGGDAGSKY